MTVTVASVPAGRARIASEWSGDGRPVVFLHAAVADRRMWRHQLAALGRSHRAIAYDRRGFGETPAVDEAYEPVVDLFAVLDQLAGPDEPAILVGCSQGGGIAIDAALAAPDRVAALVLISPSVSGAPIPAPHAAARRLNEAIDQAQKAGELEEVNRLKAALWLDGPLAAEGRVAGPARELFLAMHRIALAAPAIGRMLQPVPAWDRLARITVPVRVLCGDLDVPHIQARCRELATRVANGRFEPLPGVAHLPSLEQPELVTAVLAGL